MTYSGPRLEDLQVTIASSCMERLGDSIAYKAPGGDYLPIRGYVDFGEQARDLQTNQVIAQDISVEVTHGDVPVRPNSQCRVTIGKLPGKTYRPVNVRNSDDGDHWLFEVEQVSG